MCVCVKLQFYSMHKNFFLRALKRPCFGAASDFIQTNANNYFGLWNRKMVCKKLFCLQQTAKWAVEMQNQLPYDWATKMGNLRSNQSYFQRIPYTWNTAS